MKKILNIARTLAAVLFVLTAIGAGVMIGTGKVRTERLVEIFQAAEGEKAAAPAEELPPSAAEEIARKNLQLNRELEQLRQDFPVEVSRFEVHLAMLKREIDDRMERLKAERAAFETGKQEFEKAKKEFGRRKRRGVQEEPGSAPEDGAGRRRRDRQQLGRQGNTALFQANEIIRVDGNHRGVEQVSRQGNGRPEGSGVAEQTRRV